MEVDNSSIAGTTFFVGAVQWLMGILLAEAWYLGYSSRIDYVSDLGIGPTTVIYNVSVILFGVCIVTCTYFLDREYRFRPFTFTILVTGIGTMGVGFFPASLQPWHSVFTLLALLFGAFSAILSFRIQSSPLSYVSIILALRPLLHLLFSSHTLDSPPVLLIYSLEWPRDHLKDG